MKINKQPVWFNKFLSRETKMKKGINLIILWVIVLFVPSAHAWGDKSEKIKFISKDLQSYSEIIDGLDNDKDVEIYGMLTIPKNSEGKVPAMIYMHGSGGGFTKSANERINPWLKMFNEMGIATFKIDSFKGRGVKSTVGDQRAVSSAEMVVDVYKALDLLSKHPRIDAARIGLIGESKGGIVTLASYWKPLRDAIGTETQFALHIALYGLAFDFQTFEFTGAPFLALIGEEDDWTPAAPWIPLVEKLKKHGYDAELVIYPDAYHCFDANYDPIRYSKGFSNRDCRFSIRSDGEVFETTTGKNAYTEDGMKYCQAKKPGVMIGRNSNAKKRSKEKTKKFVSKIFRLNENLASK